MRTIRRSCGGRLIWRADPAATGLLPDKAVLKQVESRFVGLEGGIGPISLGSISPFRFCSAPNLADESAFRSYVFPKLIRLTQKWQIPQQGCATKCPLRWRDRLAW